MLEKLKDQEVVLAGDGRHDSMGHSAKYGTYTMFCCSIGLIIHILLVQVQYVFFILNYIFTQVTLGGGGVEGGSL